MKYKLYVILLLGLFTSNINADLIDLNDSTPLRQLTEEEKQYYIKNEYKNMFNIPSNVKARVLRYTKFADLNSNAITNSRVLDLEKINCNNIKGKKFDEKDSAFFFCPLKSFNLDKKRLALLYVGFGVSNDQDIADNKIASIFEKDKQHMLFTSPLVEKYEQHDLHSDVTDCGYPDHYLYFKKASYCDDQKKIAHIKQFIQDDSIIYDIYFYSDLAIKLLNEENDQEFGDTEMSMLNIITYRIIVNKDGKYLALDYSELVTIARTFYQDSYPRLVPNIYKESPENYFIEK